MISKTITKPNPPTAVTSEADESPASKPKTFKQCATFETKAWQDQLVTLLLLFKEAALVAAQTITQITLAQSKEDKKDSPFQFSILKFRRNYLASFRFRTLLSLLGLVRILTLGLLKATKLILSWDLIFTIGILKCHRARWTDILISLWRKRLRFHRLINMLRFVRILMIWRRKALFFLEIEIHHLILWLKQQNKRQALGAMTPITMMKK